MRPIDADELEEIVQTGLRENPHKDGFARVCHRTEYMHFLDVIRRMPTIAPPPNDPLTMEQLREMGLFEWIWVELIHPTKRQTFYEVQSGYYQIYEFEYGVYGENWLAYRRKPEEEQHDN